MLTKRAIQTFGLVKFPGFTFYVVDALSEHPFLQATFRARDAKPPHKPALQSTRKWPLSPDMTRSELVQTALKLVLAAQEHEVREQFTYRGKAIFGPHWNVDVLWDICQSEDAHTAK